MIIVKLKGGLGNQLFQYAIGRSIAKAGFVVKYDISDYKDYIFKMRLALFNTQLDVADKEELFAFQIKSHKDILNYWNTTKIWNNYHLFSKIFRYVLILYDRLMYIRRETIIDRYFYDKRIFKLKNDKYLDGYWADSRYFVNIRPELLNELSLRVDQVNNAIYQRYEKMISESLNSISIHVRRNYYYVDNLSYKLPMDYYQKSIDMITKKYIEYTLFIFSDDIEWAKKNFVFHNTIFIEGLGKDSDYIELTLMSKCNHNIIANSTFSWWAAWLNNNPNKIILAPRKWHKSEKAQRRFERNINRFLYGMEIISF